MNKIKHLKISIALMIIFCVCSSLIVPVNAYNIWMEGGNKGVYLHFHAWSGFGEKTKQQFDYAFDEWNFNAGSAKPTSLWIDRSGIDTSQTVRFVENNKNEITKTYLGTNGQYTMAAYATQYIYENGKYKLIEVDIDVNGSYPWVNTMAANTLLVQNSFTHEVGHVYGLEDVYSNSEYTGARPTMYGYAEYGGNSKCTIEADDIAGIRAIYGGS